MKALNFAVLFVLSFNLFAQENVSNKKLIVHGEYGFSEGNYFLLSDEYWYSKIPNFTPPADSLGFEKSNSYNFGIFINSTVKLSIEKELTIPFLSNKNIVSTLGLTMGVGSRNHAGLNFYKNTRQIIDTLTSSQTSSQYFVYENKSESIEAGYYSNSAFFGLKSMNRTNINKRLSFGLGFELAYGFSYNNRIIHTTQSNAYYENSVPQMMYDSEYKSTIYEGPVMKSILCNFPLEIGLRIQKKSGGFFENTALTLNVIPSLNWSFIEKTQAFNGIMNYSVGIRQVF